MDLGVLRLIAPVVKPQFRGTSPSRTASIPPGRSYMSVWLLLVTVLCLAPIPAQTGAGEKRYSLQGEIVDGLTGGPVTDVELTLQTAEWVPAAEPVIPDRQGRFVFKRLAAGLYVLGAS